MKVTVKKNTNPKNKIVEVELQVPEVLEAEVLDAEVVDADEIIESNSKETGDDNYIDSDIIEIDRKSDIDIIKDLLPVISPSKDLVPTEKAAKEPLYQYISELSKYKLLTREEELELVTKLHETGDIEVAKKLVMANLRLVVKIAMEYKTAYKNVLDLIHINELLY